MSDLIAIPVTQEHLDKGKPVSPCDCALALAMKDALGAERTSVGVWTASSHRKRWFGRTRADNWKLETDAAALVQAVDSPEVYGTPQPQTVHIKRRD